MGELERIGKFKVVGKLGQGSFGVVYKGHDPNIKRDVAIKICSVEDLGLRKRFAREAQISGNLQHKNIVTVFAADSDDQGIPYLVQEFLTGEDLREPIKRRQQIPSADKIDYLLQIARGLAHAHAHGVIHRDIKPANVRLLADGTVKIMDFGIAKLASAETQLTQKGVTMGTASYLPPEQVRGGDLDHRADIFSFGVLAYELMTYERPFRGNTLSALVYQILYKVPVPMSAVWPECPDVLSDLVARCLEKKPTARFASMEELIPQLTRIEEEIEAGKWPELRMASTVQLMPVEEPDDTGVLSQSEVSRAAKAVEGGAGNETSHPMLDTQAVLPSQPPAEAPPAQTASESLRTQVMRLPLPPLPQDDAGGSDAPSPDAPTMRLAQDDLASQARRIGALIEKGDLEAAKLKLEETMTATSQLPGLVPPEEAEPETPPPVPPAAEPPEIPPVIAPVADLTTAADQPLARTTPVSPSAQPTAVTRPVTATDAAHDTSVTGSYMMAILALPTRVRWAAGIAAAVVLALAGGWFLFGRGGEEPVEPTPTTPGPTRPVVDPVAPPAQPEPRGFVAVAVLPWAEVTEITDSEGYLKELPAEVHTPLRLELPPGSYRIQLQHPDHGLSSCDVEVVDAEVVPCQVELSRPEVLDYFKESGWWP